MIKKRLQNLPADLPARWLTVQQVSKYCNVSADTVRLWCRHGGLGYVKNGEGPRAPWLIDRMELDHFLETRKLTAWGRPQHPPPPPKKAS